MKMRCGSIDLPLRVGGRVPEPEDGPGVEDGHLAVGEATYTQI